MKIKGILITPNQKETKPRVYEAEIDSYKDYYPLLECDTFDIQSRRFKDKWLDIYCDDEGLFKEINRPSILTFNKNGQLVEQIVGNVFIVSHDDEGNTISLTDEEVEAVLSAVKVMAGLENNEEYTLCICGI